MKTDIVKCTLSPIFFDDIEKLPAQDQSLVAFDVTIEDGVHPEISFFDLSAIHPLGSPLVSSQDKRLLLKHITPEVDNVHEITPRSMQVSVYASRISALTETIERLYTGAILLLTESIFRKLLPLFWDNLTASVKTDFRERYGCTMGSIEEVSLLIPQLCNDATPAAIKDIKSALFDSVEMSRSSLLSHLFDVPVEERLLEVCTTWLELHVPAH